MGIKTVMTFLNSTLFRFVYSKLFGEVKVLKGNLTEMRFPEITNEQNTLLSSLADSVLRGNASEIATIDKCVFSIYDLSNEEINHIRKASDNKKE